MKRQIGLGTVAGAMLALLVALPAAAGGWASVSDAELGPPTDDGISVVRFTLLQHGVTPVDWGETTLVAVNDDSGESVSVAAAALTDGSGEWTAHLALPAAGGWSLTITHQELEVVASEPMRLTVAAPVMAGSSSVPASAAGIGLLLLLAALVLPLSAAAVLARRRASAATRAGVGPVATG